MATSSPILFRYLKQSAIVFSGEYTRTGTWSIVMISTPALKDGAEYQNTRMGMPSILGTWAWLGSASSTACGRCVAGLLYDPPRLIFSEWRAELNRGSWIARAAYPAAGGSCCKILSIGSRNT